MKPLRLGLIGFGRLAQNYYVPAFRSFSSPLDLSVADPQENCLAIAKQRLPDAKTYKNHRDLLAQATLDGLLVATPPSTHLAIWRDAAALGLAVFMEKPFLLANELESVDRDDPALERLMVNFNRRFWPAYRQLGRWVRAGRIGRPQHARFTLITNLGAWSKVTEHRLQAGEGGALYDLGSQLLDLVAITFDEAPTQVRARHSDASTDHERATLELKFNSGLSVECVLGYDRSNQEHVKIWGEHGCLRLDNPNFCMWRERKSSFANQLVQTPANLAALGFRGLVRSRSMLRYTVRAALESFVQSLSTGQALRPGFADAFRVALWTEAASRSAASQTAVSLTNPLNTGSHVQ